MANTTDLLQKAAAIAGETKAENVTAKQVGDLFTEVIKEVQSKPYVNGTYFTKVQTAAGVKDVLALYLPYEKEERPGETTFYSVEMPFATSTGSGIMTAEQVRRLETLGGEADAIKAVDDRLTAAMSWTEREISRVDLVAKGAANSVKTETETRLSADTSLQTQLNGEETARLAADTNLLARLQGNPTVATANKDPFVAFDLTNVGELNILLDDLLDSARRTTAKENGFIRITIAGEARWAYVVNRIDDEQTDKQGVTQIVFGWLTPSEEQTSLVADTSQPEPRALFRRKRRTDTAPGLWAELVPSHTTLEATAAALSGRVDAERRERLLGDEAAAKKLSTEVTNRTDADILLQQQITANLTDLTEDITALETTTGDHGRRLTATETTVNGFTQVDPFRLHGIFRLDTNSSSAAISQALGGKTYDELYAGFLRGFVTDETSYNNKISIRSTIVQADGDKKTLEILFPFIGSGRPAWLFVRFQWNATGKTWAMTAKDQYKWA